MDNSKETCLAGDPDAVGILKTLFLFLRNHNFYKSAYTLLDEWGLSKEDIEKTSNKSVLLTRCKCSKHQGNQTDTNSSARSNCKNCWLEGTFQGEKFIVKPNETHVFYVCDHCEEKNMSDRFFKNKMNKQAIKNEESDRVSPRYEATKLKSKFSKLQDEHQKLIAVTSELTTALQTNIIGQTKSIYSVLEQCKTIYPALFEHHIPPLYDNPDQENENKFLDPRNGDEHQSDITKDGRDTERTSPRSKSSHRPKSDQIPKSAKSNIIPLLELEKSSPSPSPSLPSPLTPQTVRYILETVFDRIFELEKLRSLNSVSKSPTLNRDEVEKIVNDVVNETCRPTSNLGGGEGKKDSARESSNVLSVHNKSESINYNKLKEDIVNSENEKKIRILQALRWRITKNDDSTREKVLDSYVENDVLDLFTSVSIPERLLTGYYVDHYVQESTCRLINTLASLKQGRDYLTADDRLLKSVLIKKVKDVRTLSGAVIRNMLVASVQKLSIRKQCRVKLVQEGLFEVIVNYLDDFYDKLSKYCLEYCSALLMNLCLVDEAKDRATSNPKKIVDLLSKFLDREHDYCLPYINGVMFSLFEKSELVEEATKQHLDQKIMKAIQTTKNENIKRQLDFILQSRLFGRSDTSAMEDDEDGKEEVDLLEAELDQDDYITQLPSGEKLLKEYKSDGLNKERAAPTVSFSTFKKAPPNSAKSFSEENKQFFHKPSSEKGIFETAKPRGFTTCSQNLTKNYMKNKTLNQNGARYSATPMCYQENCERMMKGKDSRCTCSRCIPGQSRYSCGCYEAIRKDVDSGDELESADGYRIARKSRW